MTLATIRTGIAANLATVTAVSAYAKTPSVIKGATAVVLPLSGDFNQSYAVTTGELTLIVRLFVPMADEQSAQDTLDGLLEPSSCKAAIEADRTLGGAVSDLRVTGWKDYGPRLVDADNYLSADLSITVYP